MNRVIGLLICLLPALMSLALYQASVGVFLTEHYKVTPELAFVSVEQIMNDQYQPDNEQMLFKASQYTVYLLALITAFLFILPNQKINTWLKCGWLFANILLPHAFLPAYYFYSRFIAKNETQPSTGRRF